MQKESLNAHGLKTTGNTELLVLAYPEIGGANFKGALRTFKQQLN